MIFFFPLPVLPRRVNLLPRPLISTYDDVGAASRAQVQSAPTCAPGTPFYSTRVRSTLGWEISRTVFLPRMMMIMMRRWWRRRMQEAQVEVMVQVARMEAAFLLGTKLDRTGPVRYCTLTTGSRGGTRTRIKIGANRSCSTTRSGTLPSRRHNSVCWEFRCSEWVIVHT